MKKKKLLEMRAAKQKRMKENLEAATNEERALNTEERGRVRNTGGRDPGH